MWIHLTNQSVTPRIKSSQDHKPGGVPAGPSAPLPSCPHVTALLTPVLDSTATKRVIHEDDIVCLQQGLWGGGEVAVQPHVRVSAAVIADLDDDPLVTRAPQSLGAAPPRPPCTTE